MIHMRRINRSAERKAQRRNTENQREIKRTERTAQEQLDILDARGVTATRERARLHKVLSSKEA